jgi:hypothetical protein
MVAHLRSQTDPLRATVYDKEPGGGGGKLHAPPPVPVELLDAADFIVTLLWSATVVVRGGIPSGRMQVPVAADAEDVAVFAADAVAEILTGLGALSERPEIVPLVEAVIGRPPSKHEWSLRTVFERWSLREEPWWAAQPCPIPSCALRAVKVTPPATPGEETRYRCEKCGWEPPNDDDGLWAEAFSRREGKAA